MWDRLRWTRSKGIRGLWSAVITPEQAAALRDDPAARLGLEDFLRATASAETLLLFVGEGGDRVRVCELTYDGKRMRWR